MQAPKEKRTFRTPLPCFKNHFSPKEAHLHFAFFSKKSNFADKPKFSMDNYIVSARKYRPQTFDSVVGQKALTTTLKNAISMVSWLMLTFSAGLAVWGRPLVRVSLPRLSTASVRKPAERPATNVKVAKRSTKGVR